MKPIQVFGLTDIGMTRPNNEDVWAALPEIGFFALADGMGGHQAGEIAAKEAIEHLLSSAKKIATTNTIELIIELKTAIEKANKWVYRLGKETPTYHGMGTTLCCLQLTETSIIYAHVGDSRLYRLRDQKLELLTQDHSLLNKWLKTPQAATCETPFPYKNVITRAVGTSSKANPEIASAERHPTDLYLLCTDGLSDVLPIEEIQTILLTTTTLEETAARLIETAKIKGSSDNMTVLLCREAKQEST
jgi:protein phosphatase